MAARMTGAGRYELFVNARAVKPLYDNATGAMNDARHRAKTKRLVSITYIDGSGRPTIYAKWENGEQTYGPR